MTGLNFRLVTVCSIFKWLMPLPKNMSSLIAAGKVFSGSIKPRPQPVLATGSGHWMAGVFACVRTGFTSSGFENKILPSDLIVCSFKAITCMSDS
jgi:hypothetical protein